MNYGMLDGNDKAPDECDTEYEYEGGDAFVDYSPGFERRMSGCSWFWEEFNRIRQEQFENLMKGDVNAIKTPIIVIGIKAQTYKDAHIVGWNYRTENTIEKSYIAVEGWELVSINGVALEDYEEGSAIVYDEFDKILHEAAEEWLENYDPY